MASDTTYRRLGSKDVRVRASNDEANSAVHTIHGVALPFGEEALVHHDQYEVFEPGAFKDAVNDVRLLVGHNRDGLPLARTKSGTLKVWETARGLEFAAELDARSPDAQSAIVALNRGDIDAVSIGFTMAGGKSVTERRDRNTWIDKIKAAAPDRRVGFL